MLNRTIIMLGLAALVAGCAKDTPPPSPVVAPPEPTGVVGQAPPAEEPAPPPAAIPICPGDPRCP